MSRVRLRYDGKMSKGKNIENKNIESDGFK
jgi:hypothetical protein